MGVKGSWSRVKDHKKFEDNYNLITWRNDMEEQDRVCPIMSTPVATVMSEYDADGDKIDVTRKSIMHAMCIKEQCMAWGVVNVLSFGGRVNGCKLIDKQ